MIVALDSAFPPPPAAVAAARAAGIRLWNGYLATKPNVGLLRPWTKSEFDLARQLGGTPVAYVSGWDDPAAVKVLATAWGVRPCLDVESGIRGDGPWVQPFLDTSGAGLYGNLGVHNGRRAPFHVLSWYVGDPHATWVASASPGTPCGWQWQNSHNEFGVTVDRCWFDDWFASEEENDDMKILKVGAAAYRLNGDGTIAQITSDQLTAYLDAGVPQQAVQAQTVATLMRDLAQPSVATNASVGALKAELDALTAAVAKLGSAKPTTLPVTGGSITLGGTP